jgi:hypothetical protein
VQWSPAELGELGVLTRALALGEDDAGRAIASLDAIDTLLHRGEANSAADPAVTGDQAGARPAADTSLLDRYLAQRAIAMDSLPRLQRLGEPAQAAMSSARPSQRTPNGPSFWSRILAKIVARRSP